MTQITDPNLSNDLVVDFYSLTQAGQDIVKNATDLGTKIQTEWNTFQITYNAMPPYFRQLLSDYENARKKELASMVQHRQQVGQLLQKASSLFEFNEQASQTVFKNMHMGGNPDNIPLTNLTPPDGWTH